MHHTGDSLVQKYSARFTWGSCLGGACMTWQLLSRLLPALFSHQRKSMKTRTVEGHSKFVLGSLHVNPLSPRWHGSKYCYAQIKVFCCCFFQVHIYSVSCRCAHVVDVEGRRFEQIWETVWVFIVRLFCHERVSVLKEHNLGCLNIWKAFTWELNLKIGTQLQHHRLSLF